MRFTIASVVLLACSASLPAQELKWKNTLLIQLQVSDLERSVRFYTEVLGFRVSERRDDLGFVHIETGISGLQLGLATGRPPAPGSSILNFGVSGDIEKARKLLESRGVAFLGPTQTIPGKVSLASFRDPDGYTIRLAGDPAK
ncbi:MAG: VOC family protein [Bryobacteraceae bacterium]|nr:VOC family protein [Bryobacteraceae bacterium]